MNKIKKILLLSIFTTLLFTTEKFAFSQEATESSIKVDTQEVREKLKERLEKADPEKVLGTDDSKLYAHFGTVTEIGKSSFIIETSDKKRVEIKLAENSELSLYVGKGVPNKDVSIEEVESGWFAIAMGNDFSENSITAIRISLSQEEIEVPQKRTVVGKVLEIEDTAITIENEQDTTIDIPKNYDLKIKGIEKPELEDITLNDKIVAIVEIIKNKENKTVYSLKSMYIVPSIKNPKAADNVVDEGTPSAEVKDATESAETE